jgi:peptidyl-prolyl cis-trans isomerase C
MNRNFKIIAAVASALLLNACSMLGKQEAPQASAASSAASVNGHAISKSSLQVFIADTARRSRGEQAPPKDKMLDELIAQELLRQEAEQMGLLRDPNNTGRLENAQRMLASQLAAESFVKKLNISDAEMQKIYDERIKDLKQEELRARHILLDSREAGLEAIASLKKGAKFEDLAKKLSKDPNSKERGGDLGWFNPRQMLPEFSEAVLKLKNGEIAPDPLQTQFGWHVVQRLDMREQAAPPFEEMKEQIRAFVQSDKLQQHIEDLKKKANIERKD